ncbi:MAG: hypothetical protein E6920_20105 [Clostridium sp.]|jgi:hypothetical protein|nr:hypothetical protein [Clostridium sp.]
MDYKSMELDNLAGYINLQLEKGRNFTEVAVEDFSCNESTLRKRLTGKKLYKRIGNKYVRQCQTIDDKNQNSNEINNVRQSVRQDVTDGNVTQIINETNTQSITVSPSDNEKFLGLISNYELIMKMLDNYKNNEDSFNKSNGLVVELPVEQKKDFRVTLRLNDVIYEEFKEFADRNKQFTVKELVSQALKEFIQKYK